MSLRARCDACPAKATQEAVILARRCLQPASPSLDLLQDEDREGIEGRAGESSQSSCHLHY
jgi:hypothetical protein